MASSPDAGAIARLRAAVGARVQFVQDAIVMAPTAALARFRLYENWREILKHAWSVRLLLLAGLFDAVSATLGFFTNDPPLGRTASAAINFACVAGAVVARLFAQTKLGDD